MTGPTFSAVWCVFVFARCRGLKERAGSSPATRAGGQLFTCGIAEVDLCGLRS